MHNTINRSTMDHQSINHHQHRGMKKRIYLAASRNFYPLQTRVFFEYKHLISETTVHEFRGYNRPSPSNIWRAVALVSANIKSNHTNINETNYMSDRMCICMYVTKGNVYMYVLSPKVLCICMYVTKGNVYMYVLSPKVMCICMCCHQR